MARARKKEPEKVVCPCCDKPRDATALAKDELAVHVLMPSWMPVGWAVQAAKGRTLSWACGTCLARCTRHATRANPKLQTFCDHPPYLAYFDRDARCSDCGATFTFTAREQRYWYEQLKFWVQSHPKQCPSCRRARRNRSRANAQLAEIMAKLDERCPKALAAAAGALLATGSRRKAAELLRRAKNLTRDEAERAELLRRVEALEA